MITYVGFLDAGDVVFLEIQRPTFAMGHDWNEDYAIENRLTLMQQAYNGNYMMIGSHWLPCPNIGKVLKSDCCGGETGYVLQPFTPKGSTAYCSD